MNERIVVLEISGLEALHLAGIVGQFRDLLADSRSEADPAIERLLPDAYPDDADASRELVVAPADASHPSPPPLVLHHRPRLHPPSAM